MRSFLLAANGLNVDQFSDFYNDLGYIPKADVGHDGQTFVPLYASRLAEDAADPDAFVPPTEDIDARPEDMMSGAFMGFHGNVGYTPLADVGADAQPLFAPALYEPVASETSVRKGDIAANGLPKEAYSQFHEGIGYNPVQDVGADAQTFAPNEKAY